MALKFGLDITADVEVYHGAERFMPDSVIRPGMRWSMLARE